MFVFECVPSMNTSHLLWWWCALLYLAMEIHGKWMHSTMCSEIIVWSARYCFRASANYATSAVHWIVLSDQPIGKVISFWPLADTYLLYSPENKKRETITFTWYWLPRPCNEHIFFFLLILHLFSFHLFRIIEGLFFVWLGFLLIFFSQSDLAEKIFSQDCF